MFFPFAAISPVLAVLMPVVVQVAALAQGSQVRKIIVVFIVIQVCYSQHHLRSGYRVRHIILSTTLLTAVLSPPKPYQPAYQAPLLMIFPVIYRHFLTVFLTVLIVLKVLTVLKSLNL